MNIVRAVIVAAFTLAFVAALAAFVLLALNHVDTTPLMMFVGGAATTLIPQMITLLKAHNAEQGVNVLQADVQEVKERTNGPLTEMQEHVKQIAASIEDKGKTP